MAIAAGTALVEAEEPMATEHVPNAPQFENLGLAAMLTAPTAQGTNTAFWGTYFSGLIYTTYFSSAVGDGASPLPTAAGSASYGFPDAGAWVMINNKPNSAAVEFNFSTAGNMAKSKAYTSENVTV